MNAFFLAAVVSCFVAWLIVCFDHLHSHLSADHDLTGVQKFHDVPVPRIGGVALLAGLSSAFVVLGLSLDETCYFWLLLVAAPAFFGGIVEDLTKTVSARSRLILTLLSAAVGHFLLDATLVRLDVPWLDMWLVSGGTFALVLTMVAVAGVTNAINLIDGYNGLASSVSCGAALVMGVMAALLGDVWLASIAFALAGALLGFLMWNYPYGKLFLGDGGAYLTGVMLAEVAVLLVSHHAEVSAWFPLLVLLYPVFETLFTIYRRLRLHQRSPGQPDACHLHHLVYLRLARWHVGSRVPRDRLLRNALTTPYLLVLWGCSAVPALLWWNNTPLLLFSAGLFAVTYVWLYQQLSHFRAPRWLIIYRPTPAVLATSTRTATMPPADSV